MPNYTVTFSVDNANIGYLPSVVTGLTDQNGRAAIPLTSMDMSGTVNVAAQATLSGNTVTAPGIPVRVVNWGTIGGTVFDQNNQPVPGATVTLNDMSGNVYRSPENPQRTVSNAQIAPVGSFSFYRIPVGQYTLSWSSGSLSGSQPVTVTQGTSTVIFNMDRNLLFPGYADSPTGSATLYGYVLDKNKNAVPGAQVTLYNTAYNGITDSWDTLAQVASTTATSSSNLSGLYNFTNVPYGTYKVIASASDAANNDHSFDTIVTLNSGGSFAYIVIPDLVTYRPPSATATPVPTAVPSAQPSNNTSVVIPGNVGGGPGAATPDSKESTDYTRKAAVAAAAVVVGTGLGLLGLFFGRFFDAIMALLTKAMILLKTYLGKLIPIDAVVDFITGFFKTYAKSIMFRKLGKIKEDEARGSVPLFMGFSSQELAIVVVASLLLGIAYLVSKQMELLSLDNLVLYCIMGGFVLVLHDLTHRYYANKYKAVVEYRFWGLGMVIMFVTALLFGLVFAVPARTIINDVKKLGIREQAIIYLSGPLMSAFLAIGFIILVPAGGFLATICLLGVSMNLLTAVYSLIPVDPLDGLKVYVWKKPAWAVAFVPLLVLYFAAVVYLF